MNRLLHGDCRGQSNLQEMWASISVFFFLPSLSQTKLALPTALFQEAKQHQVPALQKQEGEKALPSQECCSAGMLCPRRGTEPPRAPQAGSTQVDAIKRHFALNIISITKETDLKLV